MYDNLLDRSQKLDEGKNDTIAFAKDLSFNKEGKLVVPKQLFQEEQALEPTEWALRQLFSKCGPTIFGKGSSKSLPYDYLTSSVEMLTMNMNYILDNMLSQTWMIRQYNQYCRAVLDGKYPAVSNSSLLKVMKNIYDETDLPGARLTHGSHVSPDTLHVKTIWRDDTKGGYGIGTYLGNSEIGNGKIRVSPIIKRTSCDNSIILDTGSELHLELVHRGELAAIMVLVKSALGQQLGATSELIDRMIMAEAEAIPSIGDVLAGLAIKHDWDTEMVATIATGTEGNQTRAGIVNGISWAAHTMGLEPDDQTEMERLAGAYLVAPDSVFSKAVRIAQEYEE